MQAIQSRIRGRRFTQYALFAVIAAALILRAVSSGFEYLPILDDSIQYINYPKAPDYGELIEVEGLFASRPLAAIMDLFVVGQLDFALILPVLILSLLYAASGVLFWRLFNRIFGTGMAFAVFYALLPLGCEGVYWLSAASRIVPGLFFTSIAALLLEDYFDDGKTWRLIAFPIAALLSYGFYEQILVLSFALSGLQFLRRVRNTRRAWAVALVFPMLGIYFLLTRGGGRRPRGADQLCHNRRLVL